MKYRKLKNALKCLSQQYYVESGFTHCSDEMMDIEEYINTILKLVVDFGLRKTKRGVGIFKKN